MAGERKALDSGFVISRLSGNRPGLPPRDAAIGHSAARSPLHPALSSGRAEPALRPNPYIFNSLRARMIVSGTVVSQNAKVFLIFDVDLHPLHPPRCSTA